MFPRFTSLCILCPECFRLCEQGKWLLERLPKRLSRATRERSLRHESKAGGGERRNDGAVTTGAFGWQISVFKKLF